MAIQNVSDSYVLAQTAGDTYNGNASDQTYSINPNLVGAGDVITIVDQGGNNVIELPAGLQIVSSKTISNQTILTLSNGAVIDIRGADTFTFNIGQNLAGGDTVGSSLNFADFAQNVLGVTVPAPGAPVVDGGGSVTNDDGSATIEGQGPVLALTASANTVDEGASVDVSVTGAAANSTVAYTISGTGVDAADVNALTGTITTDANGAGTASIAVTADNATEGEETMTVTLDGTTVSTDIKINDTSVAPQTVDLTTGTDIIQPVDGSQTINGVASALSSARTLNPADQIDGGAGDDTLSVDMQGNFTGFTGDGFLKNVESVALSNTATIERSFDATGATGVTTYNLTGAVDLADLDSAATAVNISSRASGDTAIGYASKVTDGTSDTLNLGLNGVGTVEVKDSAGTVTTAEASTGVTAAGIETVAVTATGANVAALNTAASKAVVIAGDGSLKLTAIGAATKTIDGSAATGNLDLNLAAASAMTSVSTGSGDDKVSAILNDDLTGNAIVAGGAGTDTLMLTSGGAATVELNQSGFETLAFGDLGGAAVMSLSKTTDLATVTALAALDESVTLANATGDLIFDLQGANANNTKTITADNSGTATVNVTTPAPTATNTLPSTNDLNVTLSNAAQLSLTVADKMDYEGTITAAKATGVTAAIKGQTSGNANIVAAEAQSVVISEVTGADSTLDLDVAKATTVEINNAKALALTGSTLTAVESFTSTGAGNLSVTALSAANQVTVTNTGDVTLGGVGSDTQDYSANVTVTGSKAVSTGNLQTANQAINVSATGLTGAFTAGTANAGTGNVSVIAGTTGTAAVGNVTGKDVTVNFGDTLGTTMYGTINASGNVTITGSNLNANALGNITLTGAANSTQAVSLTGGIGNDTFVINTAAFDQTVNISGDLGIGDNGITVNGMDGKQTISIASLLNYDGATISGGAGDDTITGGSAGDTITGGAGADKLTGGTGVDTFTLANVADVKATADNILDFAAGENIAIQATAAGQFGDLHDSDGDAFDGATTGVVATVNIAGGAADLAPTDANVISINADTGNLATGYANIAALQAAVDGAAITEVGGGTFTDGDELLITWLNTTDNAYEVGIITIAGGDGFDGANETYEKLLEVDVVGGLTQAQVAAAIDFIA